ncbi:hypothetical protein GGR54DRAFT_585050, partial [Hypoxylon sp. NC1633]
MIHYGLIGSANQLMMDALIRDKLAKEMDVLCFEMEAAGLMNHFPCLVIRGICDYSDSHKNTEWQGYAAMVAAAYARDLLRIIRPSHIEAEKRITDILEQHLDIAQRQLEHQETVADILDQSRSIAQRQLDGQEHAAKKKLSNKQKECLQLFRLTNNSKEATYEWYKDRVEDRVEGTCMWLLEHANYQKWLEQESGTLLISADPGCGKSVLAKWLINEGLPRLPTICYYFFKDQDQNTTRQALCAVLHQLLSQRPDLIKHAMWHYEKDGQGLIYSTGSLWTILEDALGDSQAGPVIIVLDALDECAESEFGDLIRNLNNRFRKNQSGSSNFKLLLTSRPYEQIVSEFRDWLGGIPCIRIPGEEESEKISQEVNLVIRRRVEQLARMKRLSDEVEGVVRDKLLAIQHRTYLWVYLVFDYLEKSNIKKTPLGVESAIAKLPRSVNQAYEQILNRCEDEDRLLVRKTLNIILAATRPLTISEMNVAVNVDYTTQSFHDLDLEEDEDFKLRLRSLCGLFVSVHHGKIYLLHQTAREFLLADPQLPPPGLDWQYSITPQDAHTVLVECCVLYLDLFNSDNTEEADNSIDGPAFFDYSASNWIEHFRKAYPSDNAKIVPFAFKICDTDSGSCSTWVNTSLENDEQYGPELIVHSSSLAISSFFGLDVIVRLFLQRGDDVHYEDNKGRTPLLWAACNGHEAVARLLLKHGAQIESKDELGKTALLWTISQGHEEVSRLLLEHGAQTEARTGYGWTAFMLAASKGHEAVAQLLLELGAQIESKDKLGQTALLLAAG